MNFLLLLYIKFILLSRIEKNVGTKLDIPTQIHLSFADTVCDIVVTWSTELKSRTSICKYGRRHVEVAEENKDGPTLFVDQGVARRHQFIHRVLLKNLTENVCYKYYCGSELAWSPEYWFCVPQADENWSPSLAIYGNMGLTHAFTLPFLHDDIQQGMYDVVVHNGNFASGLNVDDGQRGDLFMKQVEAIAAYVPFMVTPGNLEEPYNFSHYRNRFSMPGNADGLYYSFNLGPVHFLAFSTEAYFFTHKYGYESYCNQFDWLQHELIESDKPENRLKRPWIITYGHRPMYCSNKNDHSCTRPENEVRVGLPDDDLMGLEELFFRYGVDIQMWSHENSYERTWPLYNYTVVGGPTPDLYYEPYAPIHIITGSAGGSGERVKFLEPMPRWSAFRSKDFGYTRLKAYNKSHLYIEHFSADQRSITDHFWIIKSGQCSSVQE